MTFELKAKDINGPGWRGEWRGKLLCEEVKKNWWKVTQDWSDPCRLYIPALDLEITYGDEWSDGPSIPFLVCKLFGRSRKDLLRNGFIHDYGYETETLYIRKDGEWEIVKVDKKTVDLVLKLAVRADGLPRWQEDLIYRGVRTHIGQKAWDKCRKLKKKRLKRISKKQNKRA